MFGRFQLLSPTLGFKFLARPLSSCSYFLPVNVNEGITSIKYDFNCRRSFLDGFKFDKDKVIADWEKSVNLSQLNADERNIHTAHLRAIRNKQEVYTDPITSFEVFTMLAHLNRGACCGNICRHCPFQHVMVPVKERQQKHFNSSFYT